MCICSLCTVTNRLDPRCLACMLTTFPTRPMTTTLYGFLPLLPACLPFIALLYPAMGHVYKELISHIARRQLLTLIWFWQNDSTNYHPPETQSFDLSTQSVIFTQHHSSILLSQYFYYTPEPKSLIELNISLSIHQFYHLLKSYI